MKKQVSVYMLAMLVTLSVLVSCNHDAALESSSLAEIQSSTVETSDNSIAATLDDQSQSSAGSSYISKAAPVTPNEVEVTSSKSVHSLEANESSGQVSTSAAFRLSSVPTYSGQAYVAVNSNAPYFDPSTLSTLSSESYSPLDALGRCGAAYACIGQDIMPTEKRGDIGQVKPSGWHTVKYDWVDGKYLYNRCHLIGYQLSAENANDRNLITGTRYLNIEGMLPFENMVADYVKETGNHVAYRVTPIFEGSNLLASGVLMEGYSVEDSGDGVSFCVFAYNVQPGVKIDYATGESSAAEQNNKTIDTPVPQSQPTTKAPAQEAPSPQTPVAATENSKSATYILNTNTKKFHYPSCSSVKRMKEANKQTYSSSRGDLLNQGYSPCGNCNP